MHVKVEVLSTEIISIKYCTVPYVVLKGNINFFYFARDFDKITCKPGVWLFTRDSTTRILLVPKRIWYF